MTNASNVPHFQQKSLQGFTFPSWDRVLIYLCALFIVCWSVGPFLWQMSTSIQPDRELMSATPHIFPYAITFEHFVNIFSGKSFHRYIINSSIAIVGPLYVLGSNFGWLDTYRVLIVIYLALGLPLVTWVLFGYFRSIPKTIDEAARIDGARPLTIFFRIILPMSLPAVVTTGLLCFIAAWNEFMFALAFTSDVNHQTVPVGIANFTGLHYVPWGDIAAASVVVTLPLVIMVLIFQQHIISGLTGGAVKE